MNLGRSVIRGIYGRVAADLNGDNEHHRHYDKLFAQSASPVPGASADTVQRHRDCVTVGAQYWEEGGCTAAVVGSFDRDEASRKEENDASFLIENYRRQGMLKALEGVRGAFSIFLLDRSNRVLHLAVDRFGRHPIYWSNHTGDLIFGPTADSVRVFPDVDATISDQGLFNYLFFHMLPSPGTIYKEIAKLPAAHCLTCGESGVELARYWRPSFQEHSATDRLQLQEALFDQLSRAVSRSSASERSCSFLSGGLDSSTVSGMLANNAEGPVDTFSIGFDAPGYDEIEYARVASKRFGTRANERYVTPNDVLDSLPGIMSYYDEPFGNSSAIPAYFCAKVAADEGYRRILAGDGGDELFAGNARYAQQRVFESYAHIPRWMRAGLIEPSVERLPDINVLFRKAKSYIRQANVPLPRRLQEYNFIYRLGPEGIFDRGFLASVDQALPQALEDGLFEEPENASALNRMLYLDWHHTLADNDLRKVSRTCELAGIEVKFPMLDDQLVDFSCTIPSKWKMPNNRLRGFFKDTVKGFLPEEIIHKKKHGFGLPFGVWMQEDRGLRELANDSLLGIKKRGFLQASLIDQAVDLHRNAHSAYYGELIWILVALEIWLSSHGQG